MTLEEAKKKDTEHVGNSDKLTLAELAYELRKTFKFKYATVEGTSGDFHEINFWDNEPKFFHWCKSWNNPQGRMYGWIATDALTISLDLSEYKDESGKVDYSKCIVEVK